MSHHIKKILTTTFFCGVFGAINAQASNAPILSGVYAGGGLGYQNIPNNTITSSIPISSDSASPIPYTSSSQENNIPEAALDKIGPVTASDAQVVRMPVLTGVYAGGGVAYPSKDYPLSNLVNTSVQKDSGENKTPQNLSGKNALTGWFIGGGLGWQHLSSNGSTSMVQGGPSASDKIKPAGNGVVGEIHAGASRTSNWFYYGGKMFVDTSSTNAKDIKNTEAVDDGIPLNMTNQVKLSKKYGVGLVGHLGTTIDSNNALYGIFGISLGQFKVRYEETEDNVSGSQTKTLFGVPLGIGYAHSLTESVRVFGEGTYTIYQSFTTKNLNPTTDDSFKAKIAPREFNLIMGVSYTF